MTAGVARTIPQGCDATQLREKACDATKRSGRELASELSTTRTMCNSSCVYALIGASVREVAAGVGLGVHAIAIIKIDRYGRRKPRESGPMSFADAEKLRTITRQVTDYVVSMGVSRALVDLAASIPHEKVHAVTRDEIAKFGIDRREFLESPWTMGQGRSGASYIGKLVVTAKAGEPKHYRTTQLLLLCGRSGFINVGLTRDLDPWDKPAAVSVAWSGTEIKLLSGKATPAATPGSAMEIWIAAAPKAFFENAIFGDTIELVETPAATATTPPRRVALSAAGLASSIGALAPRCP